VNPVRVKRRRAEVDRPVTAREVNNDLGFPIVSMACTAPASRASSKVAIHSAVSRLLVTTVEKRAFLSTKSW
jgi:hypothetical protein